MRLLLSQNCPQYCQEKINIDFRNYGSLGAYKPTLALFVVFAAGLLASARPCVYPLLSVTSAILLARGRSSRRRGLWHTAVSCLGIVFLSGLWMVRGDHRHSPLCRHDQRLGQPRLQPRLCLFRSQYAGAV
jgi:thiol:disulfide interchange protein